ncbi:MULTISPECIES: acyl-CoA dehydrogenase [unclassified Streptomyces]|uniref:acyl-CoA dehydrogenase n=1 Tax=unclassified Streptomyces TaxID=2593676 RepID=UPI0013DD6424|nr:acyl-CoA dehydrogenase [Streptomyces sp. OM5714]KAF2778557.1 acyl-CoA dehydrogenase [Streptomyces sp. OM5714]
MIGIGSRTDHLEKLLGDPWDAGNPAGFAAAVAADEREETAAAAEVALDDFGLHAEFVPTALGGRLDRVDHMVELMRSVYRRDPALGLGRSGQLLAAVNVWTAGSPGQRAAAAALLLDNRRIACAFHELAHGNDIAANTFAARHVDGGLRLSGRKESIANLDRADALVVLARTGENDGPRSRSQLFLTADRLDPARVRHLPRFRSVGMRGVRLGGMEVDGLDVPAGALLGTEGSGVDTAARAFQVTRMALPAMTTALLDTALRVTLHHTRRRTLYGREAAAIPVVRTVLAETFADLLVCEALSRAATRALQLRPESGSVHAPAVKYLVAGVLTDALERLSTVMGSEFYRRDGEHAVFQKLARDVKPVAFGHIARAACLSALLPQLPGLLRRSAREPVPAPDSLFGAEAVLPALDLPALRLASGGRDCLAASLGTVLDDELPAAVRPLAEEHVRAFAALAGAGASLRPRQLAIDAEVPVRRLAARYTVALAAAACLGVHRTAADGGFLARPHWLAAALTRLSALERPSGAQLPAGAEDALIAELTDRDDRGLSFGLDARPYL